ncbi:unnamed protein product [Lymnaea stagnalis]|uniref:RING-type domain-containing protein n=1 Tax=Lymnaea stagnalis TaxID=6523 RepID=A0AAV2IGR1_LYMST
MAEEDKDGHNLTHALVQKIIRNCPFLTEELLKRLCRLFQNIELSADFVNSLDLSKMLGIAETHKETDLLTNLGKCINIKESQETDMPNKPNFSSKEKNYCSESKETEKKVEKSSVKLNISWDEVHGQCFKSCSKVNKDRVDRVKDEDCEKYENCNDSRTREGSTVSLNDLFKWQNFHCRSENIQVYLVENTVRNEYKKEVNRICTFAKFPRSATTHSYSLAAEGFIYIGSGKDNDDEVLCCFCNKKKKDWQATDNVKIVHKQICPTCPMVTGKNCDNEPFSTTSSLSSVDPQVYKTFDRLREIRDKERQKDMESDSALEISQPASDRFHQESKHVNKNGKIQMAERSITRSVSERQKVQEQAPLNKVGSRPIQPSDNDGPSSVAPSGVEFRSSNVQDFPYALTIDSRNRSNAATSQNVEVTQTAAVKPPESSFVPQSTASGNVNTAMTLSASENSTTRPQINTTAERSNNPVEGTPTAAPATNSNTAANSGAQIGSNTAENGMSSRSNGPGPTYAELGIITERPKRTEYALRQKRLETFENWPRDHHLTPEDLSEAGFYYAGYGDCARCFYCGGGLRNWDDEDNVWVEHARWFPKCAYIRQQMGQAFIDAVQELNKQYTVIPFSRVTEKIGPVSAAFNLDTKEAPLKRDPAVKTIVDMGYLEKDVVEAALRVKAEFSIVSADAVLESLEMDGKRKVNASKIIVPYTSSNFNPQAGLESIRVLKEKNNQLRQQTVCKICMDKEVAVVFLPCGHLVSCAECATAMKDCPVCRVNIKGVIKMSQVGNQLCRAMLDQMSLRNMALWRLVTETCLNKERGILMFNAGAKSRLAHSNIFLMNARVVLMYNTTEESHKEQRQKGVDDIIRYASEIKSDHGSYTWEKFNLASESRKDL